MVNWERPFEQKDVNAQVIAFNETILNAFQNHLPNRYITINDKDPIWMNETIKSKIKTKSKLCEQYIQNGRFEVTFCFLKH